MRRLIRLLAVAVVLAATGLFGAGSASATPLAIGQCTTTSGVILAVDFSHFGGSVYHACFSTPTSGYYMLNHGGWATDGTHHDGPGFICRIGYSGFNGGTRYPTDYPCVNTPPSSAYWSYWHADANADSWSYSKSGAMSTSPGPGSVDAWIFGATDVGGTSGGPSFSPNDVRAHNTTSTGGGSGSGGSGGGSGSGGSGSGGSGSGGSTSGGAGSAGTGSAGTGAGQHLAGSTGPAMSSSKTQPGAPSGSRPVSKSPSPKMTGSPTQASSAVAGATPSGSSSSSVVDAEPAAEVKRGAGSYVPELVAGALLVVIGGFTGLRFWRRKQAGQQL